MYAPSHFSFNDPDALREFVDANNFGTLVSTHDGTLSVSRLPFLIDRKTNRLRGHLARANPHWQTLATADDVIITFDGPHAYVSPTWYATPDLVPTWNYVSVVIRGHVTLIEAPEPLWQLVSDLSTKHEAPRDPAWDPQSLSAAKRKALLRAIVGFEVTITEITGKRKLSQNRAPDDIEGVITGLRAEPDASPTDDLAELMERGL